MAHLEDLEKHQSDALLLLVGTNPLPNLVAARLLAAKDARVWLLHSDGKDGEPDTEQLAKNLWAMLDKFRDDLKIQPLVPVASSDSWEIEKTVTGIVEKLKGTRVGLNYTGATKPMAVHAYRAVERVLCETKPKPVFSYLDPRRLALRIDYANPATPPVFYLLKDADLRERVKIDVDQLARLHGYERETAAPDKISTDEVPALADLLGSLARVYSQTERRAEWEKWFEAWKCQSPLPPVQNPCVQTASAQLTQLFSQVDERTQDRIIKLLSGGHWLEEYARDCLRQVASRLPLAPPIKGPVYRSLTERSDRFELDVATVNGYQLFALSCKTTTNKEKTKLALFEIYARARQLGGDEARVGLVCCYDGGWEMEKEIARQWDAEDKIKVFDADDLVKLPQRFQNWIEMANGASKGE